VCKDGFMIASFWSRAASLSMLAGLVCAFASGCSSSSDAATNHPDGAAAADSSSKADAASHDTGVSDSGFGDVMNYEPFDSGLAVQTALALVDASSFLIVLSSKSGGTCDNAGDGTFQVIGSASLRITATGESSIAPGTYDVGPSDSTGNVIAEVILDGIQCYESRDVATSGTVVLTSVTDSKIEGSYSIEFMEGKLDGPFEATVCPKAKELATVCGTL
jgi:hypothetical protein